MRYRFIIIFVLLFMSCVPDIGEPPEKYYGEWREVQVQDVKPDKTLNITLAKINEVNLMFFGSKDSNSSFTNQTWTFDLSDGGMI